MRLHRWGLGFRQCSFHPITRVLRDDTFSVFRWPPLFRHALFPSSFRFQVNRMTQERSSGLLLTESRIQHRVPRRTVSRHAAQAFTNAPRGTRPLLSLFLARGSADGSWHAITPCSPPCLDRLGCARCDGGFGSPPLLIAAVDRRPHIAPFVSSRNIRSACDLSASGSVAKSTVLPGTVPTADRRD